MTVSHVSALGFCRATYSWQNGLGPLGQHWHGPKKHDPRTTRPVVNGTDTEACFGQCRPEQLAHLLREISVFESEFARLSVFDTSFVRLLEFDTGDSNFLSLGVFSPFSSFD